MYVHSYAVLLLFGLLVRLFPKTTIWFMSFYGSIQQICLESDCSEYMSWSKSILGTLGLQLKISVIFF